MWDINELGYKIKPLYKANYTIRGGIILAVLFIAFIVLWVLGVIQI